VSRTSIRRGVLAVVLVVAGLLAIAGTASAARPVTVYAWSGGLAPFAPLHGADLTADGTVRMLEVTTADRATGRVTVRGSIRPTPAQLARIRAAARALPSSAVRTASQATDGSYALGAARVDGEDRALLSINGADPRLNSLLAAFDDVVPASRRLEQERPAVTRQRIEETTCADRPATEIARTKTLKDAANEGLVKLSAKGGFEGDTVAVDLTGKPTSGPVTMTIHVELVDAHPFQQSDLALFAAKASKRIGTLKASNGATMTVAFDLRTRLPGDPATPCYHQITINDSPGYRSFVDAAVPPNDGAGSGTWGSQDSDWGTGFLLAHEGLHLAGLPDQYTDAFHVRGKSDVAVPATVDVNDKAALDAWARGVGRDPTAGVVVGKPRPGHADDIMATGRKTSHLLRSDVNALVRKAGVHLRGDPGDILANKSGDQQNLGVGAPLDMFAPSGGTAHRDGLWAYCVDLSRHIPAAGTGLDVLGPASALPGANMAQLQAILEAVGRHQTGLAMPDGAQVAIWAVSDGAGDFLTPEAQALLAEAGISGPLAGTAHFADANAGGPGTAAVAVGAVIPPAVVTPQPPPPTAPRIDEARLLTPHIRARRTARIRLAMSVGVIGGRLRVVVQKKTRRGFRTIGRFPPRRIAVGDSFPGLQFPPLAAGGYRLRITIGHSRADIPLTVG
jgi:hypothetical protein